MISSLPAKTRMKSLLVEQFDIKNLDIAKKFLGMKIEYGNDASIKIHQERYIQQLLLRHDMQDCSPVHTPLDIYDLSKVMQNDGQRSSRGSEGIRQHSGRPKVRHLSHPA